MKQLILIAATLVLSAGCTTMPEKTAGKKILIYTRNGPGYVHDNIAASVRALEEICDSLGILTEATDTPAVFTPGKLAGFDAVIFANTNNEAFTSQDQREAFRDFIRSGKGYMGVHCASASERDWPWFWAMTGGKFMRHPALQEFDVSVIDSSHISTKHLPATWHWQDECYYSNEFNPDIHVLLAADLRTVEDSLKVDYPGNTFGHFMPLAWCHTFDGGREWFTALGHQIKHYSDPLYRDHLRGGILWVLGAAGAEAR